MKNIVLRMTLLSFMISSSLLLLYGPQKSIEQETPQYLAAANHSPDNCPVSRLYATRMYVPIMVKEFHDPTPNWQVSSVSVTNNTSSVVTLDGNDKYAFLISTNSTDQFNFRTVASYTDGQEHQIWVEYWSQNQQIAIEQFSTEKGYFCRDFMVDTSVAPAQPDIPKMIAEAEAGTFQQLVNVVLEMYGTTQGLLVVIPASVGIFVVILIIFLIYHRSGETQIKELVRKIKFIAIEQQKNQRDLNLVSQHLIIQEKVRDENQKKSEERINNAIKTMNRHISNWGDQFTITFRSMMLETNLFRKEEIESLKSPPQIEPVPEKLDENENPSSEMFVEPELMETKFDNKKQSYSERLAFWKKNKTEKEVILTKAQWIDFYKEKKLTKEQILRIYKNREPYVQKNYQNDENAYNQFNALFDLWQEMDKQ